MGRTMSPFSLNIIRTWTSAPAGACLLASTTTWTDSVACTWVGQPHGDEGGRGEMIEGTRRTTKSG